MLKGIANIGEDVFKTVTDGFFDKQERMQRDAVHAQEKAAEAEAKATGSVKAVASNFSKGVTSQMQDRSREGGMRSQDRAQRRRYYPEEDNAAGREAEGPEFG